MVIPHPVDNGGMMEIHVRYHANNKSEANLRPNESEANAEHTKSRFFLATQD